MVCCDICNRPTIWRILKNKSVEGFKFHPYVATIMNCLLWIFYGLPIVHPNSTLVITINTIGLVLELIYTAIYFAYTDKKKRMQIVAFMLVELLVIAIIAAISLKALHTHTARSNVVGAFCVVFGVVMYSSPLTVMIGNGLGALAGAVQLILYGYYCNSRPKDDVEKPSQVQMSTGPYEGRVTP
ncbi:hypothetical protein Nepgr_007370 [Nepenthes gracilis]|uniref:Uncharacterized protein n=1 Tax=Nepenthes gracilis TaxID=150966 RepID=A0AAD3S6V2_NEPGR|nr:hypothetical protein Nepgr_007370 [Nepenthes gracilis]